MTEPKMDATVPNTADAIIHRDSFANDTTSYATAHTRTHHGTMKRQVEEDEGDDTEEDEIQTSHSKPVAASSKKLKTHVPENYFHMQMPDLGADEIIIGSMETMEADQDVKSASKGRRVVGRTVGPVIDEDDDEAQGRLEGETIWDERFRMFLQFKNTFGHTLVPKVYEDNKKLSSWVYRQRRQYNLLQAGKPSPLTEDRIKKLEDAGFVWNTRHSVAQNDVEAQRRIQAQDERWHATYGLLKQYKAKYGNCLVPKEYKAVKGLASWVYLQRGLYTKLQKGEECTLTPERIKLLEDIGFVWNAKKDLEWQKKDRSRKVDMADDSWVKHYEDLVEFKEQYGHTIVPKRYEVNQQLSSWVFRQRRLYRLRLEGKPNGIGDERLKKLQEIDFQFRIRASRSKKEDMANGITDEIPGAIAMVSDVQEIVHVNEGEIEAAVVAAVAAEEAMEQDQVSSI